jgi:uroporphyrinogen-III synthase
MIIITRQPEQVSNLSNMLKAINKESLAIPLFEITNNNIAIPNLNFDIYIFISVNSVDFFIKKHGILNDALAISVGPVTATALKGWSSQIPAEFNSQGIAKLLNQYKVKKNICVVCGEPYSDRLSFLTNHNITYYPIYKRQPASEQNLNLLKKTLHTKKISAITFSSMYSLINFHKFLLKNQSQIAPNCPWVVVNQEMAVVIKQWGYTNKVIISDNATNAAIYAILKNKII